MPGSTTRGGGIITQNFSVQYVQYEKKQALLCNMRTRLHAKLEKRKNEIDEMISRGILVVKKVNTVIEPKKIKKKKHKKNKKNKKHKKRK